MKYVISWNERPQGSPAEYENAQKRILEVFGQWKAPANFKIEFFVIRVGDWGGHLLVDCDDPLAMSQVLFDASGISVGGAAVIAVQDAVRAELEVMAWRDGLKAGNARKFFSRSEEFPRPLREECKEGRERLGFWTARPTGLPFRVDAVGDDLPDFVEVLDPCLVFAAGV